MKRKEKIISNLSKYEYISKFLGNATRKRLELAGYTRGMLTAHLDSELNKKDLIRLENTLQLGEKYCTDFKHIFKERQLPNKDLAIDGEIINILAEVKAFETLYNKGFQDIRKIKTEQGKTVDFTATRNGQNYVAEVTRINIPVSEKKRPEPDGQKHIKDNSGVNLASIYLYSSDTVMPKWEFTIKSTIKEKYKQVDEYINSLNSQDRNAKGIVIISVGRDYFVSNKYARGDMFLPRTLAQSLQNSFTELKQEVKYSCLKYIFFIEGKLESHVHIYPELIKERTS
ncbi:MAG: hypothetical protein ABID87_05615 [Chloroflexota bacterium]